ncbi:MULTISPECIES: phosphoribosyltransferase [unclassified Sphingobacterium]|uniref:phosphoribosyltransferase n=1 Tax=unclassified Sphingobacterium TaxID=2609468 RepID=UPI0010476B9A|nr:MULTISPECIES: phosphoribosyltransferase [unclassified Sphingobacterium]MCS3552328.1 putative amidophosphoribosyltransferase [Sphingobacterium sp. JUb21]TCR10906.1 hypothetical protein EDF66_101721 [Sphingobacterium sp. JUb20]
MTKFIINPNEYLKQSVDGYFHGTHARWDNTEVGFINTLKNDDGSFRYDRKDFNYTLAEAQEALCAVLLEDLIKLKKEYTVELTICVIPRAKRPDQYKKTQLLFIDTIKKFTLEHKHLFLDGTDYIQRTKDTPTTHQTQDYGSVTVGITKQTCEISQYVKGKTIILIDDIYTEGININEDAIQALYDNEAKNIILYVVGKTV